MSVTAIVLAGGRSRRFGGDKLDADLDGTTLLAVTIATVATIAERVVVAGAPRLHGPPGAGSAVTWLPDAEAGGGPLVALANVLETVVASGADGDVAVVVGGDMPRLVPAVLRAMIDRLEAGPDIEAVILEASLAQRRQVLPLAVRVEPAVRAARDGLASGDRSLRGLVDRLALVELPERAWRALDPDGATLIDIDTTADLDRLRSRPSGRSRPA